MSAYEHLNAPKKRPLKTDYPYFKKNLVSKKSPSTGNVIQGYFPVPGTDYIQSAPPPAHAGNAGPGYAVPRYIAVHKYEPATIYFSAEIPGGLPQPIRDFLNQFGMLSFHTPQVQINGRTYQRYHQVMKQFSPEGTLQSYRTADEEARAKRILDFQRRFIVHLENIFQQASGQADFQQLKQSLENLINNYYEYSGHYAKGAVISLGSDVLYTAFALLRYIQMKLEDNIPFQREVPVRVPEVQPGDRDVVAELEPGLDLMRLQTQKPGYEPGTVRRIAEPVYNMDTDGPLLLELIGEEIKIRKNQIEAEIALAKFKPVIRTGCNTSAKDLSMIMQRNTNLVFSANFEHLRLRFHQDIGWNWHAASTVPLPVSRLTSDRLVLEDAVGKSSNTYEKANAHWFAHLYGNDETADTPQIAPPLTVFSQDNPGKFRQWTPIPSYCKFNQADLLFRQRFFEVRGLAPDDAWLLTNSDGCMKIHITNQYQIAYHFRSKKEIPDIPVIDFSRATADAVIDDLLVQELAVQAYCRKNNSQPLTRSEDIRVMRERYLTHYFKDFVGMIEEW